MLFNEHKDFLFVKNSNSLSEFLTEELNKNEILIVGDLEKICEANSREKYGFARLLSIWFLLHGQKISKNGTGRFYDVSFPQVYVDANYGVQKLIRDASMQIGYLQDFAKLCGLSRGAVYSWLQGYRRVPLCAILKASQICGVNAWKFLDGYRVYSSTATKKEYFIHEFNLSPALLELLVWVKTEGSNDISGGAITVHQSLKKEDVVKTLSQRWKKYLKINPHIYKAGNKYVIKINSSPLRQIMVLKYDLPIGYKSQIITFQPEINTVNTKEELKLMLATLIETEGTIVLDRRFNLRAQIKFYSSSLRAIKDIQEILMRLGYAISAITMDKRTGSTMNYSVTIAAGITSVAKLSEDILPYMFKRNFTKLLMVMKHPKLDDSGTLLARYARGKISMGDLKKLRLEMSDARHIATYGGFPCLK